MTTPDDARSTPSDETMDLGRRLALSVLADRPYPTSADVDLAVAAAVAGLEQLGKTIDADQLHRRLEADVSVFVGDSSVLEDDDANHHPWLDRRRSEIDWAFWPAYRDWSRGRLAPEAVRALDRMTDEVLDRLEDPARPGPWDRRGMIVEQVQSGKTSNYIGLICKAADAGYKFIVVLAGLHNSLRSQTQGRLDEGFLGLDSRTSLAFTNTNRAIGVRAGGRKHPPAYTLTSSDDKGDFAKGVATRVAGRIGSDPVLLVVKKHKTILDNLIEWVTSINGRPDPGTGRLVVSSFPLLVIDDEADNASVNTKKIDYQKDEDGVVVSETNPTAINSQIRRLLYAFERSALVSYTATPFANIFIDEEERSPAYGEDLFPRSFILRMPPPSNYVGPTDVFGVSAAEDPEGVERPGLPVIRNIDDQEAWLRTGHKKDAVVGPLPKSLREALHAFILVIAARHARGQVDVHNSMLVHVTRFVAVQSQIWEQIDLEVDRLSNQLSFGGSERDSALAMLAKLWNRDFVPTFEKVPLDIRGEAISWEDVAPYIPAAASRIRVVEFNGSARDALTYTDHPEGLAVVAVGGDKLSRGLTLEGLSVSYYLRASKMYDTLMQMGRWFGYREGYNDLVRLYTTTELQQWYRDITVANEELSEKFDEMARVGSNPRDFSLYVRKSPAGLLVTASAKMRSGRTVDLTFSGAVVETIGFLRGADIQRQNLQLVENFIQQQTASGRRSPNGQHPKWIGVPGTDVASMLEQFATVDRAKKARGKLLATYIRSRVRETQLVDWTVVVISNTQARKTIPLADESIGLTMRSYHPAGVPDDARGTDYTIRRLADPLHEALDLSPAERKTADELRDAEEQRARLEYQTRELDMTKFRPPALGPFVRTVRPVSRGLLVLYLLDLEDSEFNDLPGVPGFLVSFPDSPGAPTVSYVIPRRYWEQGALF